MCERWRWRCERISPVWNSASGQSAPGLCRWRAPRSRHGNHARWTGFRSVTVSGCRPSSTGSPVGPARDGLPPSAERNNGKYTLLKALILSSTRCPTDRRHDVLPSSAKRNNGKYALLKALTPSFTRPTDQRHDVLSPSAGRDNNEYWIVSPVNYGLWSPTGAQKLDATDAEIKAPSSKKLELLIVPYFTPGVGHNEALHASPSARNSTFRSFAFPVQPWCNPLWLTEFKAPAN